MSTETEAPQDGLTSSASVASTNYQYVAFAPPAPVLFEYFTERYYHQYLVKNCKRVEGNNCRVLQHSNGLCVLCLDHTHAAVVQVRESGGAITVSSVTFGSARGQSTRTPESIKVVGKKKKNAMVCQAETTVCSIHLSNGASFAIPALIDGFMLELNAALLEHPSFVASAPTAEGYLAVINPTAKKPTVEKLEKVWTATGGDVSLEEEEA